MQILDFNSKVFLAPMAGITDKPLRKLTASFGCGNIVSEMVAINALSRKNAKTYRIADVRDEDYPVVVQLVGSDLDLFTDSAKLAEELGAYSLDLNMGCPVKKIIANKSGSYLMTDICLASKIISTVVQATSLPVSVKFRKGWDYNNINALEFAKMCEESGASYVTVHGRTRSEFYSGTADWDIIGEIKSCLNIPVIGNGDINSPQKAREMIEYTGVDGVMVGRAALGQPWLISDIHNYLEKGILPTSKPVAVVKSALLTHINWLVEYYGEKLALGLSRKYVCWYCKNMRDARKFRETYVRIDNLAQAYQEIDNYFDTYISEGE